MTFFGLAFAYLFFESSGGFFYLLTHIYGRTVFRSSAYLVWGSLLLPVANLLWFGYDYYRARKNPLFWLHTAFTSFLLVSFGDRWGIFGFWLMLLMIHYYLSGRKVKFKRLLVLAIQTLNFYSKSRHRGNSVYGNETSPMQRLRT